MRDCCREKDGSEKDCIIKLKRSLIWWRDCIDIGGFIFREI